MKKKGFTLLELLAVIVIMIVILLIFAPDVLKIINKSESNTYSVKEKLVARAGEDYVLLNKINLPSVSDQEKLINIQALVQNNFINKVYDLSNKDSECLGYIVVKKTSTYGHNYSTCLFCETYQTDNTDCHIDRMNTLDLQTPLLLMYGVSPTYVELGSAYNDQGCIALDTDNKNITDRIVTTGLPINTNLIGINTVTYDVTNANGVSADQISRQVVVRDTTVPVIEFVPNGSGTASKTHSSTVTATDLAGLFELKYLWSTSTTTPSDALFTNSFTSGSTISSPASLNGTYYLWIYAKDNNNNIARVKSNAFGFDNLPPSVATATIVSNNALNNKQAKNGDTLTLNITFSESISNTPTVTIGGRSAIVSGSGTTRTATYTIPAGESTLTEGNLAINISGYTDAANNTGNASSTITSGGSVNYDRTPPTYAYFYIGGSGNPDYISTNNTVLSTSISGATHMCVNTVSSDCSTWETYASTRAITLNTDGTKTVYMWFRDAAGNKIGPYSDTIILDTGKPTVTVATIESNNELNNKQAKNGDIITLYITFSESISNTPTVTIGGRTATVTGSGTTRTATYTIPAGESTLTEGDLAINISGYIDAANNTGNASSTITSGGTVNYDRTKPNVVYFYIGGTGNPTYITDVNTTLYSSVSGATQMCISTSSTSCNGNWESYSTTKSYALAPGEGTKTLYMWYRDAAGNVSDMEADTVIYDMSVPTVTVATIVSNNALNNKQAKNGDTLTLNITFSESISNTPTVTIGGRSATVSGSGTTRIATYTIPTDEASIAEGNIAINISNYLDASSRTGASTSTITSGGTVNYDRTKPTITYFYIGGTGNPKYISSLSTTLYSNVSGATQMCVGSGCSSWEAYSSTKAYTFGSGSYGGTLTQYIKYRDQAGNETSQTSDSILYLQASHADTYTCGVSGYSSATMGWSVSTSTVIQGSSGIYTNYYGPMYFGASTFANIRSKNTNYDITSVEVKILSHVGYARTVRLYVGGPCPTPDYGTNGISGSDPTPIGGSTNYVETSAAANSWATFTITNSTWINALLNSNAACLYINRGDSEASYWEGDGAKTTNKPTLKINWTPNP